MTLVVWVCCSCEEDRHKVSWHEDFQCTLSTNNIKAIWKLPENTWTFWRNPPPLTENFLIWKRASNTLKLLDFLNFILTNPMVPNLAYMQGHAKPLRSEFRLFQWIYCLAYDKFMTLFGQTSVHSLVLSSCHIIYSECHIYYLWLMLLLCLADMEK